MIKIIRFAPKVIFHDSVLLFDENQSFDVNTVSIINSPNFGMLNCWGKYLNNSDFKFIDILSDFLDCQLKWVYEKNIDININMPHNELLMEIAFLQIKFYNPQILFIHDYFFWNIERVKKLKSLFSHIKLMTWDGRLSHELSYYSNFDLVLCPILSSVNFYKCNNVNSHLFMFGVEEQILNISSKVEKSTELLFAANVDQKRYSNRLEIIGILLRNNIDLRVHTYGLPYNKKNKSKSHIKKILNYRYTFSDDLIISNRGGLFGENYMDEMFKSKVVINIHGDIVKNDAGNIRLFEIPASNALLFTDFRNNLVDIFNKTSYITFIDKYDVVNKYKKIKNNPNLLIDTINSMTEDIIEKHLYKFRFFELAQVLKQLL